MFGPLGVTAAAWSLVCLEVLGGGLVWGCQEAPILGVGRLLKPLETHSFGTEILIIIRKIVQTS